MNQTAKAMTRQVATALRELAYVMEDLTAGYPQSLMHTDQKLVRVAGAVYALSNSLPGLRKALEAEENAMLSQESPS